MQQTIIEKGLRFYVIDGYRVAPRRGHGRRINTIMQTCFFAISGVLPREQVGGAHSPRHPLAGAAHATRPQHRMETRGTIGRPALGVSGGDPLAQLSIRHRARRDPTTCPGVEAGPGDLQHPTEERGRVVRLLSLDEPVAAHVVAFAKKAAAFFRLALLTEHLILAAPAAPLVPLVGGQVAGLAAPGVRVRLAQPVA